MTHDEAAVAVVRVVADVIRDLTEVPSGHLYARLMKHLNLASYQAIIATLKNAGLVEEKNSLLRWIGPKG